jgi:hypothetical protein
LVDYDEKGADQFRICTAWWTATVPSRISANCAMKSAPTWSA